MGKAFFFNVSGGGHVIATYGLVGELVRRGEEVVYYEVPRFQQEIEALGAEFRPYPEIRPYTGPLARYPYHHELDLAPILTWCALEWLPQLLERVRQDRPDYVVHDSLCIWGRVIAHLLGVPAFCSIHTPALSWPMVLSHAPLWLQLPKMAVRSWRSLAGFRRMEKQLRRTYGLPRTSYFDTFTNPQPVNLCHTPRELQPGARFFDGSYHFVGSVHTRPTDGSFPVEQLSDELIYIGFGTICDPGPGFFRHCLAALGDLDTQVFMVLSHSTRRADLGEIPPNFIVWSLAEDGLAPQLDILPRARLFIMNGGMGGARESAWHGVPMVAVPTTFETNLIAIEIQRQGAGVRIPPRKVTPARLRRAARAVLADPSYGENSRRIGDACRAAGGAVRAADLIFQFLGRPGHPAGPEEGLRAAGATGAVSG